MLKYLSIIWFFSLTLFASSGSDSAAVTINYFVETNQTYSIEEVCQQDQKLFVNALEPSNARFPKNISLWMKVNIENNSTHSVEKVLKFLDIRLDRMDVYENNGTFLYSVGDMVPFKDRPYADAQIAIGISADAHQKNSLYIKFTNEHKSDLTYEVYTKKAYIKDIVFKKTVHAFFFGALVIMFIYNLILYLFIREKTFLVYIIYHVVLMIVMLYYNGLMSQYLFPEAYNVNAGNVPRFLIYMSIILAIEFLRNFLNTAKYTKKIDNTLIVFIVITMILMVKDLFIDFTGLLANNIMTPISLFLLFVSFYYTFVLKQRLALFYLFGWMTMLVAIVLTSLLAAGFIVRNEFTANIFQVGIIVEITLLSMGLAYRYKVSQIQLAEKTRILHAQSKLASMGEMLSHIAHQWRQPLSEINSVAMKIETDFRLKTLNEVSLDKNLEQIETLTEYMSKTIHDFNSYLSTDKAKTETTLETIVDKALDLVVNSFIENEISIKKVIEYEEKVYVIEGELIQVVLVLLNNARDALKQSDQSEKWIKIKIAKNKNSYVIEVEDNAGGIKEEHLEKVFEPYFTTKFEAQGVGIGLYMSKMIVEESLDGTLVASNTLKGAKFTIEL